MPWALYARVSSETQADEGLSIDAQLHALRDWAGQKGYAAREFVDAGKSAWTEDIDRRPQFKAMLETARAGEIEGIAVTHLDRFSRKLIVTLQVLGELGQRGVGFVSLENSAFDFSKPADRLLLAVLGAFAEYYSAELSRKVTRGLEQRAMQGLDVGTLEFGYCNGRCVDCKSKAGTPHQCTRWGTLPKDAPAILHPDDAPGVLLAFETYRRGNASFADVANVLNEAGYRSRTPRGRVLWNKHSVDELLSNLSYTGVVLFKGKEIKGNHPALISRELFDEVQQIRRKRRSHQATYNPKFRIYLFGGVITCAGCRRRMRAQAKGTQQRLCYRCMSRELHHACAETNTLVYEEGLAAQFEQVVTQFQLPDDWCARVCELVNGSNGKQRNAENERRRQSERLARVKQQYEWGDITEAEYIHKRSEVKAALAALQAPEMTTLVDAASYLQNMARVWKEATPAERRDMVRAILDEAVCDPDARRLVALRPKPAFRLLFRQVRGLIERDGIFEFQSGMGYNDGDERACD